jgi:hypothetical protein
MRKTNKEIYNFTQDDIEKALVSYVERWLRKPDKGINNWNVSIQRNTITTGFGLSERDEYTFSATVELVENEN